MDTFRTPHARLVSETLSVLWETAGLFQNPALLLGDDDRSKVLQSLSRLAFGDDRLPQVSGIDGEHDAFLSPHTGDNFEVWPLFGKPPQPGQPWSVFPLASWSARDIKTHLGSPDLDADKRLLRLCVVGGPESGKSTLVRALMQHSEDPIGQHSGSTHHHLVLRGQRYFVIDPPGQRPHSHGLLAAANSSELALLVVDAEEGLTRTTRRQAFVMALFGIPQLMIAVSRMDRVDYSQKVYEAIVSDLAALMSSVELVTPHCVAISAEHGENITQPSSRMPWYEGAPLLPLLQTITPSSGRNLSDARLPIQWTDGHWAGGQIASGRVNQGERLVLLPQGSEVEVAELRCGEQVKTAVAGDSVTVRLEPSMPLERGQLLSTAQGLPQRSSGLEAIMVWMGEEPREETRPYLLHHGPRMVDCHVSQVMEQLNPDSLSWDPGDGLVKGQVGKVRLTCNAPIYFDTHTGNRVMGLFSLLDRQTRTVLASGVLRGAAQDIADVTSATTRLVSEHVVIDPTLVKPEQRRARYGHPPAVLWFTGLSGSGKSAVAKEVEKRLFEHGCHTLFLDGDNVRTGLNGDLGFTQEERSESNRRVSELAALAYEQGQIVVCSFISGRAEDRAYVRELVGPDNHFEIYVNCPLEVCRSRDPKDLYKKADAGELLTFSGISIPYEAPEHPDLELNSDHETPQELAEKVWALLQQAGILT